MTRAVWIKASACWLGILACAVLNGVLREKVLIGALGSFAGLVASGLVLSACIFIVALVAAPWYGRLVSSGWFLVGLFWLVLTVAFEFGFGRFVQRNSWQELLEAYTFKGGNIWPVVLATVLLAPWAAARLRGMAGRACGKEGRGR